MKTAHKSNLALASSRQSLLSVPGQDPLFALFNSRLIFVDLGSRRRSTAAVEERDSGTVHDHHHDDHHDDHHHDHRGHSHGPSQGDSAASSSAKANAHAKNAVVYSNEQISNYLTDGYWDFKGESTRSFKLGADRKLTIDTSRLDASTQDIAERAFEVWSQATGITFVDVSRAPKIYTETSDVGATIATARAVTDNSVINGSLSKAGDVDLYKVTLQAGETYFISMNGVGGGKVNSVLRLLDASGKTLVTRDKDNSTTGAEFISFTPSKSGTFYIGASDNGNNSTGKYELSIQRSADITLTETDTGAEAWTLRQGNVVDHAYINVSPSWAKHTMNGNMLQTYMHEIGHVLGIGHAGGYNFNAVAGKSNHYANDSWSSSVMSYFSQSANVNDTASFAHLSTLMPADLIAAHKLYGAGKAGNETANTVWGPGGNLKDGFFQSFLNMWAGLEKANKNIYAGNNFAFTVYDTKGNDTLDFSAFSKNQTLNLNAEQRSNVGGLKGNVVIAKGTVIENAISGAGNDILIGNAAANRLTAGDGNDLLQAGAGHDSLFGGAGHDKLLGEAGNDMLYGGVGNDKLFGGSGNDQLFGGVGNDVLQGGAEADRLDGGFGFDTASYENATSGLRADLAKPASNSGEAKGDIYVAIEALTGSGFGDILGGDAGNNILTGLAGNDTLYGRAGNDTLYGGDGADRLIGGAGDDRLYGGEGPDLFLYEEGRDIIMDFQDNIDKIQISTSIWGGTLDELLDTAITLKDGFRLIFSDGNSLETRGISDLAALENDISFV